MLVHFIEDWLRHRTTRATDGTSYELEIRLGLCIDARRECRLRSSTFDTRHSFVSNVNALLFYGTFESLARRAATVSEACSSTHMRYEQTSRHLRRETTTTTTRSERWCDKRLMRVADVSMQPRWFDARLAFSSETLVAEPDAIREARAIAGRVRNPLHNERTRASFPTHTRSRLRRSLTFAEAPTWRLDFTCVDTSHLARHAADGGGVEYSMSSTRSNTATSSGQSAVLELELECIADDACTLLDILATAMGSSRDEIRARIDADWERYDRSAVY